ncbi:MAG: hypothetical protein QOJ15_6543 [Bradyrhizobium sp.]|nr:hypothetical protein [Bradyrhizobium sp.]
MARIRSVHPGLFKDEAFMELSMAARVLVIGIWTLADDHGVFEWKPRLIRAEVFPSDNVEIEPLLDELIAQHCIQRFNNSGRTYAVIRNFCLYQRPRMPSYRHPFPRDVSNYAGIERRKAEELVQASSRKPSSKTTDDDSPAAGLPQPNGSPTEKSPHRRGEKGRGREEESQTDRSESVVVVVPDAKAEMTTTTTISKPTSQGKAGLGGLRGRPLPADWVPDAPLCEKVLANFGMGVEDISAELPAFHALNVQNGTVSQDWHATFYLFAKRWSGRRDRRRASSFPRRRRRPSRLSHPRRIGIPLRRCTRKPADGRTSSVLIHSRAAVAAQSRSCKSTVSIQRPAKNSGRLYLPSRGAIHNEPNPCSFHPS